MFSSTLGSLWGKFELRQSLCETRALPYNAPVKQTGTLTGEKLEVKEGVGGQERGEKREAGQDPAWQDRQPGWKEVAV